MRIESRGPSCSEADLGLHCGETSHDAPPLSTSPYTYQLHILSLQSCYIVSLSGSGAAAEWMLMSDCSHLHQRLQHPRLQLQRQLALTLDVKASVTVNIESVYRCATSISCTVSSGSHQLRVSDFKKKILATFVSVGGKNGFIRTSLACSTSQAPGDNFALLQYDAKDVCKTLQKNKADFDSFFFITLVLL